MFHKIAHVRCPFVIQLLHTWISINQTNWFCNIRLHLLFQNLISILWLFIFYVWFYWYTPYGFFLFCCILFFTLFCNHILFFLCSLFFLLLSYLTVLCTSITSCTPVLSLFYPAPYVFGFLLILLGGCCHFLWQRTGSSSQMQPVQSAHGQESCWTAGQTLAR